uniref:Uncharacterized protein n=1 Tax=Medicago truncatula TaxID=3880 RepID=I3SGD5_MEDTR|nr:unknown [Medicago truncatula]
MEDLFFNQLVTECQILKEEIQSRNYHQNHFHYHHHHHFQPKLHQHHHFLQS